MAEAEAVSKITQLLNECQLSQAVHGRAAKALVDIRRNHPAAFASTLTACLQHVLLTPKGNSDAERMVKFLAILVTRPDDTASELECEEAEEFLEQLLTFLVSHTAVADKHVRYRACQLQAEVLERLEEEINEEVWDAMKVALLERLRDKAVPVRMQAARALARLQEADANELVDDSVAQAYLQMLGTERSKDVRKVVLGSLVVSDVTLSQLVDRTRDVHPEVRRVAFLALAAKAEMANLTIAQRATVARRGLRDRDPKARAAAVELLHNWLRASADCPVALLRGLDVESHEEVGELVMLQLLSDGTVKAAEVATRDAATSGLRRAAVDTAVVLLDTETALYWRTVCEDLQHKADVQGTSAANACGTAATLSAAAASEQLDALEAALPQTVSAFFDLVAAHARAGAQHRAAAQQLLRLVPILNLADGVGHQMGVTLVGELLAEAACADSYACGGDEKWERAVAAAAQHVHSSLDAFQQALLQAAQALHSEQTGECSGTEDAVASPQLAAERQSLLLLAFMLESMAATRDRLDGHPVQQQLLRAERTHFLHTLVLPAIQHPAAGVRADGVRCLGLFMLVQGAGRLEPAYVQLLRGALGQDTPVVAASAARALLDLALCVGPARLDDCLVALTPVSSSVDAAGAGTDTPTLMALAALLEGEEAADPVDEETNARSLAVQGLAKLLMFDRAGDARSGAAEDVLGTLLALYFTMDESRCPRAAQCLTVFFPAFAASSPGHRAQLASATLLALRTCAGSKRVARVSQYALYLLQQSSDASNNASLVAALLSEAQAAYSTCVRKTVKAAYASACLKLAAGLPVHPAPTPDNRKALHLTQELLEATAEKALQKELLALEENLQAAIGADAPETLSEEELLEVANLAQRHLADQQAIGGHFGAGSTEVSTSSVGSAGTGSPTSLGASRGRRFSAVAAPPSRASRTRASKTSALRTLRPETAAGEVGESEEVEPVSVESAAPVTAPPMDDTESVYEYATEDEVEEAPVKRETEAPTRPVEAKRTSRRTCSPKAVGKSATSPKTPEPPPQATRSRRALQESN